MATVLVVDDAAVMRRNLNIILERNGHKVIAESTEGYDAYLKYKKYNPDIVTMDITMPKMNGIESVKKIMASDPTAKIIMISALGQKRMVLEALRSGARHFIVKPITPDKITQAFKKVLNSKNKVDISKIEQEDDPDKTQKAFNIKKEKNKFVVKLNNSLDENNFSKLESALQVCLKMDSVNIDFKLNKIKTMDQKLIDKLSEIIEKLNSKKGEIYVFSDNMNLIDFIKENDKKLLKEVIIYKKDEPPFEFICKSKKLILKINEGFKEKDIRELKVALNSTIYIKPLHIIMKIKKLNINKNLIFSRIEDILCKIKDLNGKIEVLDDNGNKIDLIKKIESPPFEILNNSESFLIKINENYDKSNFNYFLEAFSIISYLTPQITIIKIIDDEKIDSDLKDSLEDSIKSLDERGGRIEIYSDNAIFSEIVKKGNNILWNDINENEE